MPPAKDHATRALCGSRETSSKKATAYGTAKKMLALASFVIVYVPAVELTLHLAVRAQ